MTRCNIFVVGAMKCGTTVLYDWLSEHPEVSGCQPEAGASRGKELHYFTLYGARGLEWYHRQKLHPERPNWVDASPTYGDLCLEQDCLERIREYNPQARLIYLIRDPLARAISHYLHLRRINRLPEVVELSAEGFFTAALAAAGAAATADLTTLTQRVLSFSLYEAKVRKLHDVFGTEHLLVLDNEDLRPAHVGQTLQGLWRFLGLSEHLSPQQSLEKYQIGTTFGEMSVRLQGRLRAFFGEDYLRAHELAASLGVSLGRCATTPIALRCGMRRQAAIIGRDGHLFLDGGSNDPFGMFSADGVWGEALIGAWQSRLAQRLAWGRERGWAYWHLIVPEKATVWAEHAPYAYDPAAAFGDRLHAALIPGVRQQVVRASALFRQRRQAGLYWRRDSHWNQRGAGLACQLLCARIGLKVPDQLFGRGQRPVRWPGDLAAMVDRDLREDGVWWDVPRHAVRTYANALVECHEAGDANDASLHVGTVVNYRNEHAPNDVRLLLFGDSFCEYRPHLLTGYLAECCAEVRFVWGTSLDLEVIDAFGPDIVLTAHTERFMNRVPDDTWSVAAHVQRVLAARSQRLAGAP